MAIEEQSFKRMEKSEYLPNFIELGQKCRTEEGVIGNIDELSADGWPCLVRLRTKQGQRIREHWKFLTPIDDQQIDLFT
jgi:hypothetical protein